MILVTAAVLLEWARLFAVGRRNAFWWTCHAVIFVNSALYTSGIIATWLTCRPPQKSWNKWLPGQCFDRKTMDEIIVIFNLIFDLIIFLLPQRVIWQLHASTKRKWGIALVFSVGLMYVIVLQGDIHCFTDG